MQVKKFNWAKRPSRWEHAQAWRAQRQQMTQRFRDESAAAANAFAGAQYNHYTGMATLAAQASIQRAQDEIKAARSQFAGAANSVNFLA